ncbi:MAG: helix-turn-helix transcriptional regulator [Oscillospiraceae bacterium]|nr:helix-turn-helix transcriptional regulator [Oscillospiraceae bacterium]
MTFDEHLAEMMQDPGFRAEYERLRPEYEIIDQLIAARSDQGLTQKELAQRIGIRQSNISRLESGNYNPSLAFLKKVAAGLGKQLHVEFRTPPA